MKLVIFLIIFLVFNSVSANEEYYCEITVIGSAAFVVNHSEENQILKLDYFKDGYNLLRGLKNKARCERVLNDINSSQTRIKRCKKELHVTKNQK